MEAMSEGKLEEAVEHLTKAILLNPTSTIMYGTRASVFVKMKKLVAAIRDVNAALEVMIIFPFCPLTFYLDSEMLMRGGGSLF
ncbi:FAM10 family protein At4g22670-like [Triticum dicoccoides]|uniref:FAM10 family protein At4g22670-like n=1 Tax=Triticum dicoccoides TaxID=85692 RepID=UPI000E7B639A|nr:FAM10 family protein At4g22670-like [Triticum dicoccoides]